MNLLIRRKQSDLNFAFLEREMIIIVLNRLLSLKQISEAAQKLLKKYG
jgi:hypothetical protein